MKNYTNKIFSLYTIEELNKFLENDKIILEIGSGNGIFLEYLGKKFVDYSVIGIELDIKRAKKCKNRIQRNSLKNTIILSGDATNILPLFFNNNTVNETYMNFPEPWPRDRNWRNRLYEIGFLSMIDRITKVGGKFHLSTDVEYIYNMTNEIFTKILGNWVFDEVLSLEYKSTFIPTLYYEKWTLEGRNFWWGVWKKQY
ncbi:MAG: methyltransferase domain-containing protein [Brevinematales bacterium]|nr:methyltransferase domain-containing protein [Brevinematales bacterium]